MTHTIRWTAEKITQRLALIEPLVYRRQRGAAAVPLPGAARSRGRTADRARRGRPRLARDRAQHALGTARPRLRAAVACSRCPPRGEHDQPLALHLPLGEVADFSHPEALVYVDGQPYAACDRHHQEIRLRPDWHDGRPHALALHGWTGLERK